jgi:hypothetical protein
MDKIKKNKKRKKSTNTLYAAVFCKKTGARLVSEDNTTNASYVGQKYFADVISLARVISSLIPWLTEMMNAMEEANQKVQLIPFFFCGVSSFDVTVIYSPLW